MVLVHNGHYTADIIGYCHHQLKSHYFMEATEIQLLRKLSYILRNFSVRVMLFKLIIAA
jgi:hypothetical protein